MVHAHIFRADAADILVICIEFADAPNTVLLIVFVEPGQMFYVARIGKAANGFSLSIVIDVERWLYSPIHLILRVAIYSWVFHYFFPWSLACAHVSGRSGEWRKVDPVQPVRS